MPIAVLVSGSGTNLEALLVAEADAAYEVAVVISDRPGVKAIDRAEAAGVPAVVVDWSEFPDRGSFTVAVCDAAEEYGAEALVLAGFMRVLASAAIQRFPQRILNIHPSLLPSFPGSRAVEEALAHGVKVTGVTVHFVDEQVDHGPISRPAAGRRARGRHPRHPAFPNPDRGAPFVPRRRQLPSPATACASKGVASSGTGMSGPKGPRSAEPFSPCPNTTGLIDLARRLIAEGVELIASGGTAARWSRLGLEVTPVADVDRFARDPLRTGEDTAPRSPRRDPGRSGTARAPRRSRGARHRPHRPGRGQPVPVRRDGGASRGRSRRGGRADRHRRRRPDSCRRQEPRPRRRGGQPR